MDHWETIDNWLTNGFRERYESTEQLVEVLEEILQAFASIRDSWMEDNAGDPEAGAILSSFLLDVAEGEALKAWRQTGDPECFAINTWLFCKSVQLCNLVLLQRRRRSGGSESPDRSVGMTTDDRKGGGRYGKKRHAERRF